MAEHIMKDAELASMLKSQLNSDNKRETSLTDDETLHLSEEDIRWWRDAKLGLFIHWGIYAIVGKGEWSYFNEKIPEDDYRVIAEIQFHPELSPKEIAREWISTAKETGMEYAVMVTRHHDGFSLWDSKHSWKDFTSAKVGPKQDYVKAFTEECRENNIGVGLYYSPMDWRFPGYFDPEGLTENAQLMKEQAYNQLEELTTNYGKIDIIWYDGGWLAHKGDDADAAWLWEPVKLNKKIRSHQPKVMVTPRSGYKGDFKCNEGPQEVKGGIISEPWEKCMSIASTWGYIQEDKYWSSEYIIRMLVNVICRGGNLLLNVGPDPDGRITKQAKDVLHDLGIWIKENGESVYGTRGGIWEPVDDIYGSTCKNDVVYLHVLDCEAFENMVLAPIECKIAGACLMNKEKVEFSQEEEGIHIRIPESVKAEKRLDTIIKIFLLSEL